MPRATPSAYRSGMNARSFTAALAVATGLGAAAPPAAAQDAAALRARHAALAPRLAASPFGRPLWLESDMSAGRPRGEVIAVVEHPFPRVLAALREARHWCDVLILPFNVKRCEVAGSPQAPLVRVAAARRADQPAGDAYPLEFRFDASATRDDHLAVRLTAEHGPLGTRDYRLVFEAAPLDARRSVVRLGYAYTAGLAARLATETYLATSGRDKVGFSIVGTDAAGRPQHVLGWRGIAERNTMRYHLAVEATLDTLGEPPERRLEARLRRWFAAVDAYPQQLREMPLDDYLAMKRREAAATG